MSSLSLAGRRGLKRRLAGAVAAAVFALLPARAGADDGSPLTKRPLAEALRVRPGASCIDAAPLAEEIASWLGAREVDADIAISVDGDDDDPLTAVCRLTRRGHVFAERRFAPGPERCDHFQAVVGLAIALGLRASVLDGLLPKEASRGAAAGATPRDGAWAVGADALVAVEVLPGASGGADVRLERALPQNFGVRLGLWALTGAGKSINGLDGRYDVQLLALRVDGCVSFDLARHLQGRGCLGLLGGGLFAEGRGFSGAQASTIGWFAAANAIDLTFDLEGGWSVDAALTLVLPIERSSLGVRAADGSVLASRELGSAGGALGVGPVYRF